MIKDYAQRSQSRFIKSWLSALFSLSFVILSWQASASHYRYGNISWQLLTNDTVEITVQQAWRLSSYYGVTLNGSTNTYENLNVSGYGSTQIVLDVTAVNSAEDWFFGVYKRKLYMPGATNVRAYFSSCCRISGLQNNSSGSMASETFITVGNGNSSPQSAISPIVNLQVGQSPATFQVAAVDPDGDPLSFRLATSSETGVSNLSGFTVTSNGLASFNTTSASVGQLYNAMVTVEDTAGAKTVLDFLIRIVPQSNAPSWDYAVTPSNGSTIDVNPGTPINFSLKAFDLDVADQVSISAVGIPVGAVHSPSLPSVGGNPDSSSFSWTPGSGDIGSYVISYTAEDNNGVQTSTSVNILVNADPYFVVPPTPMAGMHLVHEPGDLIQWNAEAADFDPNDSVQIISATGKDKLSGLPVPLYSGASFSSLPTAAANPTMGSFSWTPLPSQWGHRHVILTAEDELANTKKHEISMLINTAPAFSSMGDTCVWVDSLYYYQVSVLDQDTLQGDSLDLYAFNLPPWLTFTDLGNGHGVLSGTPTTLDLGTANIMLEAHDIHHHANGKAVQHLSIQVKNTTVQTDSSECATDTVLLVSDSDWMQSTVGEMGPFSGPWSGASALPAASSYTNPVVIGQPYSYHSIDALAGSQVIKADNNVTFYRSELNLSNTNDVRLHLQSRMDDGMEVYVNGVLLLREEDIDASNWKNEPHDVLFEENASTINGFGGNQSFDYVATVDLDTVLQFGANEIVVALFNLTGANDRGGFTFRLEAEVPCPATDSCVSDSSWELSTVNTQSNWGGNWTGVNGMLPHDSTYTLNAEEGQPYLWGGVPAVEGSQPVKAGNNIRYYRKRFKVLDRLDVDARIRMYMDDAAELYLNGVLIASEFDSHSSNWNGVSHELKYDADGTIHNGNGAQPFDQVANVDLDTVLVDGENQLVVALYNYRGKKNKGGFSFRLDMTKAGQPNIVPVKGAIKITAGFNRLIAYPNPTSGLIHIVVDTQSKEERQLLISDLSGRLLKEQRVSGRINQFTADLDGYEPGLYLVQLVIGSEVYTQKVIKY